MKTILYFLFLSILVSSCIQTSSAEEASQVGTSENEEAIPSEKEEIKAPIPAYKFLLDTTLANGFDFPVGDKNGKGSYVSPEGKKYNGWYIAVKTAQEYSHGIHTGEDWNGVGGGETDFGQPVYATAKGKVISAENFGGNWGNIILLEHRYIENGKAKTVFSLYAHLDSIAVKKDTWVTRRQQIGSIGNAGGVFPAHLHFEIRKETLANVLPTYWPSSDGKDAKWITKHYEKPSNFIQEHRSITSPFNEPYLLVVVKHKNQLHTFKNGTLIKTYEIGLSQDPFGHKKKQGDLKLPEGEYNIVEKKTGPFPSEVGPWLGIAWMRLNYPNTFDAAVAFEEGNISESEKNKISAAFKKGYDTPNNTYLGGDVGIHGWNGDWDLDGSRALTWGCITMHNNSIEELYPLTPLQTKIIILP